MREQQIGDPTRLEDLEKDEVVLQIFEHDNPADVERFRVFHNLTTEQIEAMRYYVRLRATTLEQMRQDIERRKQINPIATQEELSMGAYQEMIEPQVRDAMRVMRQKGYTTTSSGFSGLHSQSIHFAQPHLREWHVPDYLLIALHKKNITLRVKESVIVFECENALSIDEVQEAWNLIADDVPDLGGPAAASETGMAKSFRKRQESLIVK